MNEMDFPSFPCTLYPNGKEKCSCESQSFLLKFRDLSETDGKLRQLMLELGVSASVAMKNDGIL